MREITLIIPGNPPAKKRPRFFRRGNKGVGAYKDPAEQTEEGRWLLYAAEQLKGQIDAPLSGPVFLHAVFFLPRPKGHYGSGRNAGKLKASAPRWHVKKPDVDNMIKFAKDCLNGLLWNDDCQVVSEVAGKRYVKGNGEPHTTIRIVKVEDECTG